MLAFVMLWAYFSFSQYLIIWSGNLPEEIDWYLHRLQAGWRFVAITLVIFHFAVPFVCCFARRQARTQCDRQSGGGDSRGSPRRSVLADRTGVPSRGHRRELDGHRGSPDARVDLDGLLSCRSSADARFFRCTTRSSRKRSGRHRAHREKPKAAHQ